MLLVLRSRARKGAAAVEFAVVAPLLFMLILGMIEFSRMMMVQQILTNSAREGARIAVVPGATQTEVNQKIDNYLAGTGVSGHTKSVPANLSAIPSGDPVTVTVSVSYDSVSWLPLNTLGFLKGKQLGAKVVMRKE